MLQLANPGTIYQLKTEKDELGNDRFKYVFMSLGASIQRLPHLRRVVVIDDTHLYGKYKDCLLTTCCQDANFQVFPIGFAVVESENDESWKWFIYKLSEIIVDGYDLTIVSERHISIYKAKAELYPKVCLGCCLVHLRRNMKTKFKRKGREFLASLVWQAGEMFRIRDSKGVMNGLNAGISVAGSSWKMLVLKIGQGLTVQGKGTTLCRVTSLNH